MKLLVDRVTTETSDETYLGDSAWRDAHLALSDAPGSPELGDLTLELQARMLSADLYLQGQVDGSSELTCSRCLARYGAPIREQFRLVLEPAGDRIPADPEGAEALAADGLALGDELETGWFRGPEIHFDRYLAEMVVLALPVQPLCREECQGLCPRCGVDRNNESCDCSDTQPNSPFQALEKLRGTLSRGEDEGEAR